VINKSAMGSDLENEKANTAFMQTAAPPLTLSQSVGRTSITLIAPMRCGVTTMFQISNDQTTVIFPLFLGCLAILLALLNKPLLRFIGLKPLSEVFKTPHFQRSAKITEKLGRLFLVVFGIGFLVQEVGTQFLSSEAIYIVSIIILGLSGLIILAMSGVVLANWKGK
jgi:hypothetical protein